MGFWDTPHSFVRHLIKKARHPDSSVRREELMPPAWYVEQIYDKGYADSYTWAIRTEGDHLLQHDYALQWLSDHKKSEEFTVNFRHDFTSEFEGLCEDMHDAVGLYSFWTEDDEICLYVGRSVTGLGRRMASSFSRFSKYNRPVFVRYALCHTKSDAVLSEVYYISVLEPTYNSLDAYCDGLTLSVAGMPDWSSRVRVNLLHDNSLEYSGKIGGNNGY